MQQDGIARVLVASRDGTLCDSVASVLEEAGYVVVRACDADEAVGTVRRSPYPLVVLFDSDCLDLLASVGSDRRLCRHHAYVVLLPEGSSASPRWVDWYPQLVLSVLTLPLDRQALLAAVARAIWALGIAAGARLGGGHV